MDIEEDKDGPEPEGALDVEVYPSASIKFPNCSKISVRPLVTIPTSFWTLEMTAALDSERKNNSHIDEKYLKDQRVVSKLERLHPEKKL